MSQSAKNNAKAKSAQAKAKPSQKAGTTADEESDEGEESDDEDQTPYEDATYMIMESYNRQGPRAAGENRSGPRPMCYA